MVRFWITFLFWKNVQRIPVVGCGKFSILGVFHCPAYFAVCQAQFCLAMATNIVLNDNFILYWYSINSVYWIQQLTKNVSVFFTGTWKYVNSFFDSLIISHYFTGVYMLIMLSVSLVQVLMIRSLFNTKDTHNLKVSTWFCLHNVGELTSSSCNRFTYLYTALVDFY